MSTAYCRCPDPQPVAKGGVVVCFGCGGLVKQNAAKKQENGGTIDAAQLKREVSMLRRQMNQRLDAIVELIDRHAD